MSRSTFNPENNWKIDEFIEHFDVAYQDLSDMRRYQELMLKSYLSPDEQLELTTITNKQRDKIWMSEDLNVLQDCIVALETFFKDNTIPQLQQFIKDLQAERDSAVGTINAEEAAALAEMQRLMQEYSDTIIGGLHTHSASQITGLARVATTNNYSDLTGLPDISATGHQHTWGQITEKPTSFTPSSHTHDDRYYTETEMNTKLAAKADNVHSHDDRYYTDAEMDVKLNAKSNTGHVHAISDVTGLQGELNGLKQSLANSQSNLATRLVNKGVSANASEALSVLINKVDNIKNIKKSGNYVDVTTSSFVLPCESSSLNISTSGSTHNHIMCYYHSSTHQTITITSDSPIDITNVTFGEVYKSVTNKTFTMGDRGVIIFNQDGSNWTIKSNQLISVTKRVIVD